MTKGTKIRGKVIDINDPSNLDRIKIQLTGFDEKKNTTPWAWPCLPFAGNLYGISILPQIGDEVWAEQTYEGDWVYTGFFYSDRNLKPEGSSATVRMLRTPSGHQVKFDENGDIEIIHNNENHVALKKNGDTDVYANGKVIINGVEIQLNDNSGKVVTTECLCSFTGLPHSQGSRTVKAEGPF